MSLRFSGPSWGRRISLLLLFLSAASAPRIDRRDRLSSSAVQKPLSPPGGRPALTSGSRRQTASDKAHRRRKPCPFTSGQADRPDDRY